MCIQDPSPHTLTMTRCLQYLEAQTQQKLLIQASSCTSPHWATHSGEHQKRRGKPSVIFTYTVFLHCFSHSESSTFKTGASVLRSRAKWSEGLRDRLTFHIMAEVTVPHLCHNHRMTLPLRLILEDLLEFPQIYEAQNARTMILQSL